MWQVRDLLPWVISAPGQVVRYYVAFSGALYPNITARKGQPLFCVTPVWEGATLIYDHDQLPGGADTR